MNNMILQGDNINSLNYLLENNKKFEVIYIDPPYNTNLKDLGYTDVFKKKEWNKFMEDRLSIAQKIMTDDGLIFISIDENSFIELKPICDRIFKHCVQTFIWKCRGGANDGKFNASCNHEYILCYAKTKNGTRLRGIPKDFNSYKNPDNDPNGPWIKDGGTAASGTDDYIYPIVNPYTGEEYFPPNGRYWAFPKYRVEEWTKSGKIVFGKNKGEGMIIKRYKNQIKHDELTVSSTVLVDEESFLTLHGTKEFRRIFPEGRKFKYPKPVELVSYLINLHHNKDAKVLDFFAGSGTTGQSVVEQNKKDGGKRTFVLCTNNENDICQNVTCERMKRLNIDFEFIEFSETINEKYIKEEINLEEELLKILDSTKNNDKKIKDIKKLFKNI